MEKVTHKASVFCLLKRASAAVLLLAFVSFIPVWADNPNPDLSVGAIQYNENAFPQNLLPYLSASLATRFNLIGTANKVDLSPYNVAWWDYMDGGGGYVPQIYDYYHTAAAQRGWNYESMLLHYNRDYTVANGATGPTTWYQLDCFDIFEEHLGGLGQGVGACNQAINGVFVFNGTQYSDVTQPIYAGNCGPTCGVANGSSLFIGYAEPFVLMNFTLSTPQSGGTVAWQYWNDSAWAALTLGTDGTHNLTQSGAIQFSPPVNWAPKAINGSQSKFWVRLNISLTTTAPQIGRLWGDDWLSHSAICSGGCNSRGWNPGTCQSPLVTMNDANHTQYCAQPSASATAQFRYQGRATGYWNHNYLFADPGDVQGGIPTEVGTEITRWAAQRTPGSQHPTNPNALMLDNVGEFPQPSDPTWNPNDTDAPCSPNCSSSDWQSYIGPLMQGIVSGMKSTYPHVRYVGGNDGTTAYKSIFDFNVYELTVNASNIADLQYHFDNFFDSWLPANNPTNSKMQDAIWDNQHFNLCLSQPPPQTCHIWDQGNRTPMLVLATYYIAANVNTLLLSNTQGWSYYDTAEYYPFSSSTGTLASGLTSDISTNNKNISVANSSQFTTVGGPLYGSVYALRIGGKDVLQCTKSGNTFSTTSPIVNSYPAGTKVEFAYVAYWPDPNRPVVNPSEMWYYANWWPAMWVDIGTPDPNGWNGGARDITYLIGTAASGQPSCNPIGQGPQCAEVWRRDFTNAVILDRTFGSVTLATELDLPGPPINLVDPSKKLNGPYYRLNSDGTTGPAITSLTLVGGEAAILMKNPIGSGGGGGPGTLGTPTLSLPQYLPITSQITAGYNGAPVDHFQWTFTPQTPGGTTGTGTGATGGAPAGTGNSGAGTASFSTQGPVAGLSGQPLQLGLYSITVQAFDAQGNGSPTAQAQTTLVPGDLSGVREYPNPWRSDVASGHPITFDNLTVNTTIKIFTVSGHWVKTLPTSSSSVTWDLTNDSGDKVASGMYIYLMTTDTGQKATGKLAIIR